MRLPVEDFRRRALRIGLIALGPTALSGCAVFGSDSDFADLGPAPTGPAYQNAGTGPAADYPVVVGDPYRIGSTVFTPADTLNYDEVGYAVADSGNGVSGSHHTLPLPSYIEVTALDTGKTILVRLERRGPMNGDSLVALSPAAFAQIGAAPGVPVRVRRVNPQEEERAMLRLGQTAPSRMDTPESLLAVLKRKLPASGSVQLARSEPPRPIAGVAVAPSNVGQSAAPAYAPPAQARPTSAPALPPLGQSQAQQAYSAPPPAYSPPQRVAQPAPVQPQVASASNGAFIVQVAALSSYDSAQRVANVIGGRVTQTGSLFRIRTGPFATRGQAEASLAKVRAAGYSDARIFTNG
ncbi:sporulation protein SsgA [Altererythrobacter salegens]|uniref:Sporulation protein SsgA n=1 Tax=Croceibacterium salegens TaxID=1737568 RepID=A0A6I4SSJ5_9SPHN|nr:SPOR domain-containing protein [Croceibacterium salegens]MXO58853.1 sporulation protein SsgA [Croceibacterium salegens]